MNVKLFSSDQGLHRFEKQCLSSGGLLNDDE